MSRIVNNRICYANHNVVLREGLHEKCPDFVFDMAEALSPDGKPSTHRQELEDMNNDGSWAIEMPTVTITLDTNQPMQRMEVTVTLFNGNYDKVVCVATCSRNEGFLPLYGAMRQHGLNIGQKARREAETEYFKRYDAYVEANK